MWYTQYAPEQGGSIGHTDNVPPVAGASLESRGSKRLSEERIVVRVWKVAYTFHLDEYLFKDRKGHTKSTKREEWISEGHGDEKVWIYRDKKVTYVSEKKIG